jgi:hypothetical protein
LLPSGSPLFSAGGDSCWVEVAGCGVAALSCAGVAVAPGTGTLSGGFTDDSGILAGSGTGCTGFASGTAGPWGADAGTSSITDLPDGPTDRYVRLKQVNINTTAAPVVSLPRNVEPPPPPKSVWEAPPKAAPISAPLPVWRRTIKMSARQAKTWNITIIVYIQSVLAFQIWNSTMR